MAVVEEEAPTAPTAPTVIVSLNMATKMKAMNLVRTAVAAVVEEVVPEKPLPVDPWSVKQLHARTMDASASHLTPFPWSSAPQTGVPPRCCNQLQLPILIATPPAAQ